MLVDGCRGRASRRGVLLAFLICLLTLAWIPSVEPAPPSNKPHKPSSPKTAKFAKNHKRKITLPPVRQVRADFKFRHEQGNALVTSPGLVAPLATYGYILGCRATRNAAVIDPGGRADELMKLIEEEGLKVTHILLTHEHLDHIGAVADIKNATGAPVYLHVAGLDMYNLKGIPLPLAGSSSLWSSSFARKVVDAVGDILLHPYPQPPPPEVLLNDGDVIQVGELLLDVIHLPGHSAGSVAYIESTQGVVFSGDVVMQGGVGRSDLPGCSGYDMYHSLKKLYETLTNPDIVPSDAMLYSGHARPVSVAVEVERNQDLPPQMTFVLGHLLNALSLWGVILGLPLFLLSNLLRYAWFGKTEKKKVSAAKKEQ